MKNSMNDVMQKYKKPTTKIQLGYKIFAALNATHYGVITNNEQQVKK